MSSISEKLELLVTMDPSKAQNAIKGLSDKVESETKKMESSFTRIGAGMMKVGGAGIGVGAVLTAMGSKEQAASQQLEAAIGAAGQAVEEFSGKIDSAVGHAEKYGFTADQTKNSLTTLTGAFGDTGAALDHMQLVEDLAKNRHIDLASAADMVAKAHGGSARLFKLFGIQVQQNADGTKDYDGALGQLSQKLQGQAAAASDTFMGKVDALRASVEDAVASFGEHWGPAILGVSTGITALGGIMSGAGALIGKLTATTEADTAAKSENIAVTEEDAVANEQLGSSSLAAKAGFLGIAAGVAVGVGALYQYGQSLNKTTFDQKDFAKLGEQSWDTQTQAAVKMTEQFKGPFANSIDDLIKHYRDMGPAGVDELTRIRDALAAAGQDTSKYDEAIAGAAQAQDNMKTSTDGVTQSQKDEAAALDATNKMFQNQLNAVQTLFGANLSAREAQDAVTDAVAKYDDAQKKANESGGDAAAKQHDLESATTSALNAIDSQAQALVKQADNQAEASGQTLSARDNQRIYMQSLMDTAGTLAPGSPLRSQLEMYIMQLAQTDGTFEATITADTTPAEIKLHQFLNSIPDLATISVGGGNFKQRAHGGPVTKGEGYIVGENGPEFFMPSSNGQIIPNSKTTPGSIGMGGGMNVNLTVNSLDAQGAAYAVREALEEVARTYGFSPRVKQAITA